MLDRRNVMILGSSMLFMSAAAPLRARMAGKGNVAAELAALEARVRGRLGVCFLDAGNGRMTGHRLNERFAMCSTFKMPLAALILREIDAGRLKADQWVPYGRDALVANSPITREEAGKGGMTVLALARATQTTSDNAAANLLLPLLGGPEGFTRRIRQLGDKVTRVDRYEPSMNLVMPGDSRDTTSPAAMAVLLRRFAMGGVLSPASRETLLRWMRDTRTGMKRLRAGLPSDWPAGDKTGTGGSDSMTNKVNDVAIAWPPNRAPVIIACYFDTLRAGEPVREQDQAVLAEVGRLAAQWVKG